MWIPGDLGVEKLYQQGTSLVQSERRHHLKLFPAAKRSRETNVEAVFRPSWGTDGTWFNKPHTFRLHIFTTVALLRYIASKMLKINASLFLSTEGLFKCKLLLLFHHCSLFPSWPNTLNLGSPEVIYLVTSQQHPCPWICLIVWHIWRLLMLWLAYIFVTWNILSCLELDLFPCSSICQLCVVDFLWVVGQSYNSHSVSWSNPISELLCPHSCVSPVSGSFWSRLTEMDGIHTTLRLDCVMRYCAGFKRKWCLPLLVHQPLRGSHFDLRHSTICDCSFRGSNTIADKVLRTLLGNMMSNQILNEVINWLTVQCTGSSSPDAFQDT